MKKSTVWTRFMDMHGGGYPKIDSIDYIYIEADQDQAELIFKDQFRIDPNSVSCECCGDDYLIQEYDSLEEATMYDRTRYGKPSLSLEEHLEREDVIVIHSEGE